MTAERYHEPSPPHPRPAFAADLAASGRYTAEAAGGRVPPADARWNCPKGLASGPAPLHRRGGRREAASCGSDVRLRRTGPMASSSTSRSPPISVAGGYGRTLMHRGRA